MRRSWRKLPGSRPCLLLSRCTYRYTSAPIKSGNGKILPVLPNARNPQSYDSSFRIQSLAKSQASKHPAGSRNNPIKTLRGREDFLDMF